MSATNQAKIDPMARELAFMKPGQRRELSSCNGIAVVLERATVGRKGRIIRESIKGFVVLQTVTF